MPTRMILGNRGGLYGGWISKPGYDAFSAGPGDMLLNTDLQVFQTVLKGTNVVLVNNIAASYPAGNNFTYVSLPAEFAPYSNLYMYVTLYATQSTGGDLADIRSFSNGDNFTFNVVNGVIQFNYYRGSPQTASPGGVTVTTYYAAWNVFRGQF